MSNDREYPASPGAVIGRDSEVERLHVALGSGGGRRPTAVAVIGDPGIGKSTLLRELVDRHPEFVTVRTTGSSRDQAWRYGALHSTVLDLAGHLPAVEAPVADVLGHVVAPLPATPPPPPAAIASGFLQLLERAAESAPILWVIDDADDLDGESSNVVRSVLRDLRHPNVRTAIAARPDVDLSSISLSDTVELAGLSDHDAWRLVASLTRETSSAGVRREVAAAAGNHPLVITEYCRLLPDEQLAGRFPMPETWPLSNRLRRCFPFALHQYPAADQSILIRVTVADAPLPDTAATGGIDGGREALDRLAAAGLILRSPAGLHLPSQVHRSLILAQTAPVRRRAAHADLARSLRASDPDRAVWHHASSFERPEQSVLDELCATGTRLALERSRSWGTRIIGHALSLSQAPDAVGRLSYLAARLAIAGGHIEQATAYVNVGLRQVTDPGIRADLIRAGDFAAYIRDATVQTAVLHREALRVADTDPDRAASLCLQGVLHLADRAELEAARSLLALAERLQPRPGADAAGRFHRTRAWLSVLAGDLDAARGHVALDVGTPSDLGDLAERFARTVLVHQANEDWDEARAVLDRWRQTPGLAGAPISEAECARLATLIELDAGDLDAAAALIAHSNEAAGAAVASASMRYSLTARIAAYRGQLDVARSSIRRAQVGAARSNANMIDVSVAHSLGLIAMIAGELGNAVVHLRAAARGCADSPNLAIFRIHGDLIECEWMIGDRTAARRTLDDLCGKQQACPTAWGAAVIARSTALVAPGPESVELYEVAVAADDPRVSRLERGRLHAQFAQRLDDLGDRQRSSSEAQQARQIFKATGADGLVALMERRNGPASTPSGGSLAGRKLTKRELEVLHLLRADSSNRDIAKRLYLSIRTVEVHVRRVYRKLGIHSRKELLEIFSDDAPG